MITSLLSIKAHFLEHSIKEDFVNCLKKETISSSSNGLMPNPIPSEFTFWDKKVPLETITLIPQHYYKIFFLST